MKKRIIPTLKTVMNITIIIMILAFLLGAMVLFSSKVKGDDANKLFNITSTGDTTCGSECRSYITITVNRLPVASDWVNMSVGVSLDTVDKPTLTTGDVLNTGVLLPSVNSVYNWTGRIGNKDFQVLEYLGKSCVNITFDTENTEGQVIKTYTEQCSDVTQPVSIQDLIQRRLKTGDKINLVIVGHKEADENVKWGFKIGDAMIDPYWNSYYGFNFMSTSFSYLNIVNSTTSGFATRFLYLSNETTTIVSRMCILGNRVGTAPTYNIGLVNDSSGTPSTKWLGGTNQGYCTITPSSTAVNYICCNLIENVTISNNTHYWQKINYSSGTISNSNALRVAGALTSTGETLKDSYIQDMTNRNITYATSLNQVLWTNNTLYGSMFKINTTQAEYGTSYTRQTFPITLRDGLIEDFEAQLINLTEKINVTSLEFMTQETGTPNCWGEFGIYNGTIPLTNYSNWSSQVLAKCYVPSIWSGTAIRGCSFNSTTLKTGTYSLYLRTPNSTCDTLSDYIDINFVDSTTAGLNQELSYDGITSYYYWREASTISNDTDADIPFRMNYTIGESAGVSPTVSNNYPTQNTVILDNDNPTFKCNVTDTDSNINSTTIKIYNTTTLIYNFTNTTVINATTPVLMNFTMQLLPKTTNLFYNCSATDTTGLTTTTTNTSFIRTNTTTPTAQLNVISIDKYYKQNDIINITDETILTYKPYSLICNLSSSFGIRYAYLDDDSSLGFGQQPSIKYYVNFSTNGSYPINYQFNITLPQDSSPGAGDNWTFINQTRNWQCYAESLSGNPKNYTDSYGNSNITLGHDITPIVYIVTVVDTETATIDLTKFKSTLDFSNYLPGNHTWNAFFNDTTGSVYADWRTQNNDSYNNKPVVTWFDMTTKIYWNNTNGLSNDPVYDKFINNATYEAARSYFGDDYEFHYHNHQWYNATKYNADYPSMTNQPYTPANYWNQVIHFDNQTRLGINNYSNENRTAQENIEEVFSNRILVENEFPSVYRSGWLFVDTNFSNWLEGTIKYSYNVLSSRLDNTDTEEPVENVYNWTNIQARYFEPYHPDTSNYKNIGNMSRWEFECSGGAIDTGSANLAFQQAYNRGTIVLCYYTHNYGANPDVIGDYAETTNDNLNTALATYELAKFKYVTALQAAQAYDRDTKNCSTDTTQPILIFSNDTNYWYVQSSEELFSKPYLAINLTNGRYLRGNVENNGTLKWKANKTEYSNVDSFLFAATDICGNTVVQSGESNLVILNPNTTNYATVIYPQNLSVNFSVISGSTYITENINFFNATINQTLMTTYTSTQYIGSNIWQTNISINNLTTGQYYTLSLCINYTTTNTILCNNQTNAVYYTPANTCTYGGSGNWNILWRDNCTITNLNINITGYLNLSNSSGYGNFTITNTTINATKLYLQECYGYCRFKRNQSREKYG